MTLSILNSNDKFMELMKIYADYNEKAGYYRGIGTHEIITGGEEDDGCQIHLTKEKEYLHLAKNCLHDIVEHLLRMK